MKFIKGMMKVYHSEAVYYSDSEYKNRIEPIFMHIYSTFPEPAKILEANRADGGYFAEAADIYDLYEWLDLVFSHLNRNDISLETAEKLYELYRSELGDKNFRTARMLVRIGCAKRKYGDIENALEFMEKGREIIRSLENRTKEETLYISDTDLVIINLLMNYYNISDDPKLLDKCSELCREIISVRTNFKDEDEHELIDLVYPYCDLALIECYKDDYNRSSYWLDLAERECEVLSDPYHYSVKEAVQAKIAHHKGEFHKAVYYQSAAIRHRAECFGEHDNITVIRMKKELGDMYMKMGDTAKAHSVYKNAFDILEKLPCRNDKIYYELKENIRLIEKN